MPLSARGREPPNRRSCIPGPITRQRQVEVEPEAAKQHGAGKSRRERGRVGHAEASSRHRPRPCQCSRHIDFLAEHHGAGATQDVADHAAEGGRDDSMVMAIIGPAPAACALCAPETRRASPRIQPEQVTGLAKQRHYKKPMMETMVHPTR